MNQIGLLNPLWDKLSTEIPKGDLLNGQQLSVTSKKTAVYLAVDAADRAHFLLAPSPASVPKLAKFSFKGLSFEVKNWVVADQLQKRYLDIVCTGGSKSSLRRPFAKFCEDVLVELETTSGAPEDAVYRTCVRWQRFWAQEESDEFTPEWARGLLGELCILERLIRQNPSGAVAAWTGPDGNDQDFQAFGIGVEVKTTVVMPPRLTVSNLRQLDSSLFKRLLVSLYVLTPSDDGINLPEQVKKVESLLDQDDETRDVFWSKLSRSGYRRHLEDLYGAHRYVIAENAEWFDVDDSFPKITADSFADPLDKRISRIQYVVEMSGLRSLDQETDVDPVLRLLCGV
jgi:hypothetical protein